MMEAFPLSSYQHRFWLEWKLNPGSTAYNTPLVFEFTGKLDVESLEKALRDFVNKYDDGSRSVFVLDGASPKRVVREDVPVLLAKSDISGRTDAEILAWIKELISRSFDLEKPDLFRFHLGLASGFRSFLVLNFHHVISDAFSAIYINKCLSQLYNHYAFGRELTIEPPVFSHRFHLVDEKYLSSERRNSDTEFWLNYLGNMDLSLSLPASIGATGNERSEFVYVELTKEQSKSFRGWCRTRGLTPFIAMASVYGAVLARLLDRPEIPVTYPVNVRSREFTNSSGCFVNNLPLRLQVTPGDSIETLAKAIRDHRRVAKMHQELSFAILIEQLRQKRGATGGKVFNVSITEAYFAQENPLNFEGIGSRLLDANPPERPFDLNLAYQTNERIAIKLEYNQGRVSEAFVQKAADLLRRFLADAETVAKRPIDELSLFDEREYQEDIRDWNATRRPIALPHTIPALFREVVGKFADRTAVELGAQRLSYRELHVKSDCLAGYLQERLGSKGKIVEPKIALLLERSLELVISLMAIQKIGGSYVPLDTECPAERVAAILDVAKPDYVIIQEKFSELLSGCADRLAIDVSAEWEQVETFTAPEIDPLSLSYVIFTSGTTGTPKGVMNSHLGLVNRLEHQDGLHRLRSDDKVMQKTPYYFDVSVWEFFWPLTRGATLVLAPPHQHRDPAALERTIRETKVTLLHFVPTMLGAFLSVTEGSPLPHVRSVFCSGEALYLDAVKDFWKKFPRAELWNLYGPTEAAIDVSGWRCQRSDTLPVAPIGKPFSNVQLYILDSQLRPQPRGVPGNLFIGGIAPARGYLSRPDLTAEKFVPDPLAEDPGSRMYFTGDTAVMLQGANLYYLGRNDHQLKINGNRIELGDVEAAFYSHPEVETAAVVSREVNGRVTQLIAYLQCRRDAGERDEAFWRDYLAARLPAYMVPARVFRVAAMPRLPNGKLDQKQLQEIAARQGASGMARVAPRSETESAIAECWSKFLSAGEVSLSDHFFSLGASSIQAIELVAKLKEKFGVDIPPQAVFMHPVLSDYAREVLKYRALHAKESGDLERFVSRLSEEEVDYILTAV